MNPPRVNDWSPLRLGEWAMVFVAGFCAMILFFFRFYAGVFALEIYEDRGVELPFLTIAALQGMLPVMVGLTTAGLVAIGLVPPVSQRPNLRLGVFITALGLGFTSTALLLWAVYAPLA